MRKKGGAERFVGDEGKLRYFAESRGKTSGQNNTVHSDNEFWIWKFGNLDLEEVGVRHCKGCRT